MFFLGLKWIYLPTTQTTNATPLARWKSTPFQLSACKSGKTTMLATPDLNAP
jgi:hypothetical protein